MKVVTIVKYGNPEAMAEHRPRHREYLSALKQQGKLAASGPFEDDSGALMIYEVENLHEAERLLEADPFREVGVFQTYTMKPWRQVL